MKIIEFNGLGQPKTEGVETGQILILFNHDSTEVVILELLPPEEYGPSLTPAKNWKELESEAYMEIKKHHLECLKSESHWVFECPNQISAKAIF